MSTRTTPARGGTPTKRPSAALTSFALRGALGGIAGGVVFGALNMWFAHSMGMPADMPLMMIATIVQGEAALAAGTASSVLGLVVHMILSASFGVVLALLIRRLRTDALRALAGLVFGLGLYLVNFLVISPIAFGVFQDANQPLELTTHLVFGSVAVLFLLDWRTSTRARR